jgi:hypothetical protein
MILLALLALLCGPVDAHAPGVASTQPASAPGSLSGSLEARKAATEDTEKATGKATSAPTPEPLERRAFRLTQSWEHAAHVLAAADRWDVSPWLLLALIYAESRLECTRVNPRSGAAGCGQFTRAGIRGLNRIRAHRGDPRTFTRALALDPREGISATAELLGYLVSRYGVRRGVAHYNGGRHARGFASGVLRQERRLRMEAGLPPPADPKRRRPPAPSPRRRSPNS